jgi:hypothetical protein
VAVAERTGARSTDDLARNRPFVEYLIGRPLRHAEQAMDVLGLDEALNNEKEELDLAIRAEQKYAVHRAVQRQRKIKLQLTHRMLQPLEQLFRLGRQEARAELARLGYPVIHRQLVAQPQHPELDQHAETLKVALAGLSVKLERNRAEVDLADVSQDAIVRALLKVPGARSIAAAAISKALTAGLSATFTANADLVPCWEYTAVLDAGSCEICAPLDGTEYHSIDELFDVLPGFGPNPLCLGGDRCRCRAIPCGPDG